MFVPPTLNPRSAAVSPIIQTMNKPPNSPPHQPPASEFQDISITLSSDSTSSSPCGILSTDSSPIKNDDRLDAHSQTTQHHDSPVMNSMLTPPAMLALSSPPCLHSLAHPIVVPSAGFPPSLLICLSLPPSVTDCIFTSSSKPNSLRKD